jgi:hypothetical protein
VPALRPRKPIGRAEFERTQPKDSFVEAGQRADRIGGFLYVPRNKFSAKPSRPLCGWLLVVQQACAAAQECADAEEEPEIVPAATIGKCVDANTAMEYVAYERKEDCEAIPEAHEESGRVIRFSETCLLLMLSNVHSAF